MSITTLPWPLAPKSTTDPLAMALLFAAGEAWHGRVPRLGDAVGGDHPHEGEPQDLQVEREGAVLDVPGVQAQALFPRLRVAAIHLRPAGDAGPHVVAARLLGRIERQVLHEERARADDA